MNENLIATVVATESRSAKILKSEPYCNRKNVWGWRFLLWHAGQYHFISISNVECRIPTLTEVAAGLRGVRIIQDERWGAYENIKQVPGYYASVLSEKSFDGQKHWYMVARSNDLKNLRRMARDARTPQEIRDLIEHLDLSDSGRNAA